MAQDKGKNIVPASPMNPPPTSFPNPFEKKPQRCDGDGCASDPDTWPLHHMIRGGVRCRLCCSCILLSHRSFYCCRCFFLVTSPSSNYDDGDKLMAPPAPTLTCLVCREAVVHLPCLYHEPAAAAAAAGGIFVCPPCTAAQNGMAFSYGPPCKQPLDAREARMLVLAGRISLALLKRHAAAARANAERLAMEARDARKMAAEAINVAYDLAKKEDPSWVPPQSAENDLAAASSEEEEGIEAEANVGQVLLVRRNKMPSLATLTIGGAGSSAVPMALAEMPSSSLATQTIGGTGGSVVPMALAEAPSSSQSKPLFDLNEEAAEDEAENVQAEVTPHPALNSFNVKEVAMAAAEAARASASAPLKPQLFPSAKASSSTKMPRTKKARTKRPRTLQLLKNDDRA